MQWAFSECCRWEQEFIAGYLVTGSTAPFPAMFLPCLIRKCFLSCRLCSSGAENVGVTSIDDGHGGAPEQLTAGGTKLNLKQSQSVTELPSKAKIHGFFAGHNTLLTESPVAG